jgi:hypothetical protein
MRIPSKYLIRETNPKVKQVCKHYGFEKTQNGSILCRLVFMSLEMKNKHSMWREYFSSLPKNFDFLFVNYPKEDLVLVKHTVLERFISHTKAKKDMLFKILTQDKQYDISKEEFDQLYFAIKTRTFTPFTLCPYGDMLNTGPTESINAQWDFDKLNGDFYIYAIKNIKKDEEIFLYYSEAWNNFQFLNSYGFTVPRLSQEDYTLDSSFNIYNRKSHCTSLKFSFVPRLKNYKLEEFDKCIRASEIPEGSSFQSFSLMLIRRELSDKNKAYLTTLEVIIHL